MEKEELIIENNQLKKENEFLKKEFEELELKFKKESEDKSFWILRCNSFEEKLKAFKAVIKAYKIIEND